MPNLGETIEWESKQKPNHVSSFRLSDMNLEGPHGGYTSSKMPMSLTIAYAAHFADRSYGAQFTAAAMTLMDQKWDDSQPMARQSWYCKLQAARIDAEKISTLS